MPTNPSPLTLFDEQRHSLNFWTLISFLKGYSVSFVFVVFFFQLQHRFHNLSMFQVTIFKIF